VGFLRRSGARREEGISVDIYFFFNRFLSDDAVPEITTKIKYFLRGKKAYAETNWEWDLC